MEDALLSLVVGGMRDHLAHSLPGHTCLPLCSVNT